MPNAILEQKVSDLDPRLKQLEKVDRLADSSGPRMTELTNQEAIDFAILEALNDQKIIEIPGCIKFIEALRENRVSLDRKGRKEFLQALIGTTSGGKTNVEHVGVPSSMHPPEEKRSWWKFWKRGDE
ncbi:hypothetical protein RJ40_02345 [Methanofollis aquaemaris]|uniref:Uncharacterized protein n=1 Tax=Methanofollis aquaemaris TaxID=126734 RepID=A0A8A3S221_9EURY|nr:hypothetical protein [Methanofollis aquaemaris]QSZ66417.1 hypothetical protein RJ40_02345 [Methanofollis aquaemaris]